MGYDYQTKQYMITWRGKQYNKKCHRAIVNGIEYDISGWIDTDKYVDAWLWNDTIKDGKLFSSQEKVDTYIEAIVPYIPPEKSKNKQQYDHPDATSFSEGLILYILAMIFGFIFKDRWAVWIGGSIIFWAWAAKKPKW